MNGITCEKDAQRAQTIYNELTVSNFLFVGEDSYPHSLEDDVLAIAFSRIGSVQSF